MLYIMSFSAELGQTFIQIQTKARYDRRLWSNGFPNKQIIMLILCASNLKDLYGYNQRFLENV